MKVLLVAPNISMRMGGEAVLPYHCWRELTAAGIEVTALTHARVREELKASSLWREGAFHFVEDAASERTLYRFGQRLPAALRDTAVESLVTTITLSRLARRARRLAGALGVDIIHQMTPVSPRLPSFMTNMPAPVIIGPLNGNMSYPPAFRRAHSPASEALVGLARVFSGAANAMIPGKTRASRVLVANERTRAGLPAGIRPEKIETLVENGVDLSAWSPPETVREVPPTFVFVGRLIRLKCVDLLIEAFAALRGDARLVIIGDGEERATLECKAVDSGAGKRISFLGFCPPAEIRHHLTKAAALVLPSMRDCGGAVVLEAFACRTPAIATDWGGPQDYITQETGFLIAPDSRDGFVANITAAMQQFLDDPELTREMGAAARRRIEDHFSWRAKAEALIEIYRRVLAGR